MHIFTSRVIAIVRRIPEGRVTTYGAIAAAAGNSGGARQVVRILYSSSQKYGLPWHRVVNRKGEIPPRHSMSHVLQRSLLVEEGVRFTRSGYVDFSRSLWLP